MKIEYFNPPIQTTINSDLGLYELIDDGLFEPAIMIADKSVVTILGRFQSDSYVSKQALIILCDHEVIAVDSGLVDYEFHPDLPPPSLPYEVETFLD